MDRTKIKPELFFAIFFPLLMAGGLLLIHRFAPGEGLVFWSVATLICVAYAHRWAELLYAILAPRRWLPRLEDEDISLSHRTVVAMSTLLRDENETQATLKNLEQNFLNNTEEIFLYCLLADFSDSHTETEESDERLVRELRLRIDELNRKHGDRFFALIRPRRWNSSEAKWMGWERKRGKLVELNRWLLRKESDEIYLERFGPVEKARGSRFVIPLDEDTCIAKSGALRLVATLAHPANAPVCNETGRLVFGYSILSPAIKNFNSLIEPYSNIDTSKMFQQTRRIPSTLFGQMYCGKGIYDVQAFDRTTEGLFPENRILSHDRLEGLCGNVVFIPDVTFWEEAPENPRVYFRRFERWVSGDIQALVMLRKISGRGGVLAAWSLIYPILQALIYPALIFLWLTYIFQGTEIISVLVLTVIGISGLLRQLANIAAATLAMLRVSPLRSTWNCLVCMAELLRRDLLTLGFILSYAKGTSRAFFKSTYRLLISKRNLLEWIPSGEVA